MTLFRTVLLGGTVLGVIITRHLQDKVNKFHR